MLISADTAAELWTTARDRVRWRKIGAGIFFFFWSSGRVGPCMREAEGTCGRSLPSCPRIIDHPSISTAIHLRVDPLHAASQPPSTIQQLAQTLLDTAKASHDHTMAWRCSGASNAELIANMRSASLITTPRVAEAMSLVDRAHYVPTARLAYQDSPQPIGFGATISAPHMHAHAAENLLPFLHRDAKVLDVGSGSGYTLAVFHHLISSEQGQGKAVGVDHIQQLVDQAHANLCADGLAPQLDSGKIVNICGDGRAGVESEAPFDAIHVGAAAPGIPQALMDQLKAPGRMFIPVEEQDGSGQQNIYQVDKSAAGEITKQKICGVMYVPLTDAEKQWRA